MGGLIIQSPSESLVKKIVNYAIKKYDDNGEQFYFASSKKVVNVKVKLAKNFELQIGLRYNVPFSELKNKALLLEFRRDKKSFEII